MAIELVMPRVTQSMEEGKIISWLKREGEAVEKGEPLFVLESDKASVEFEAPASGVLAKIVAETGETLPVGTLIGYLAQPGEPMPDKVGTVASASASVAAETSQPVPYGLMLSRPSTGLKASPLAKKLAGLHGVDIGQLYGSGPEGRIIKADVLAAAEVLLTRKSTVVTHAAGPALTSGRALAVAPAPSEDGELVGLSKRRRATGQRMLQSLHEAPHFYLHREVDVSQLEDLRRKVMPRIEKETGSRPSLTALLVKVAATALRRFPRANARFEDGNARLMSNVNIGVAMATADGLMVPVIRDADRKSLAQITTDLAVLRDRTQASSFKLEDVTGGTLTISNLGMYGIDFVESIINPPEAAILSAGRTVRRPVVGEGDEVIIKPMMHLVLSVDHRVLDGADGAQFLGEVASLIDDPLAII